MTDDAILSAFELLSKPQTMERLEKEISILKLNEKNAREASYRYYEPTGNTEDEEDLVSVRAYVPKQQASIPMPPPPAGCDPALIELLKAWYLAGYQAAVFEHRST